MLRVCYNPAGWVPTPELLIWWIWDGAQDRVSGKFPGDANVAGLRNEL